MNQSGERLKNQPRFWMLLVIKVKFETWPDMYIKKTCEYICLHAHTRTNKCIWLYMRIYFQSCRYKPEIRDPKLYLPESCPCWSFIHWGLFKQYWPTNFVLDLTQSAWMSYINPLIQAWSMVPLHLPLRIIYEQSAESADPLTPHTPPCTFPDCCPEIGVWSWCWLINSNPPGVQIQTQIPKKKHIKQKGFLHKTQWSIMSSWQVPIYTTQKHGYCDFLTPKFLALCQKPNLKVIEFLQQKSHLTGIQIDGFGVPKRSFVTRNLWKPTPLHRC